MIFSILFNYTGGVVIDFAERSKKYATKKCLLIGIIAVNISVLFYYKYLLFFLRNLNGLFKTQIEIPEIALPIGISFFTFQAMTYVIDLYRKEVLVQKNPLHVALYIALFPQLIAGPIVRYKDINNQIISRNVSMEKFASGVRYFSYGLAKKVIIANTVAYPADQIFSAPLSGMSIGTAWIGAMCYTAQIYFDFSGYSDMAIGLGKMFGFEFLPNFNLPYISRSITEFWRRWHISLSTFFRDYVYIPLGGNRKGTLRTYINLFMVFLLTGLWHGAAWNFVLWGIWHGAFLIMEKVLMKKNVYKVHPFIGWLYTFLIVVIGWVLFRAPTLTHASEYLAIMFGISKPQYVGFTALWYANKKVLFVMFIAIFASCSYTPILSRLKERWNKGVTILETVWPTVLLLISMMMAMTSTYNPFIYFRF